MSDAISGKAIVKALNGKADVHFAFGNISAAGELRTWAARIERGDFSITSPAEERYREALESTLSALEMLSAGLPVANLDEVIANAITTLSTSPSGEQADGNKKRFPGINAPEKEDTNG